jgi:diguanylate cyclase (GGDEF)-like protein
MAAAAGEPAAGEPAAGEPAQDDDEPVPFLDAETGLESAAVWNDALRHEDARRARYGHPATVMVMELVGFELLGERLGSEIADRLIVPVAATLLNNSRASDRIARVGHTRFHVLMPETDEISAINYVERVREAADMWLEAGAVAVRTAIGWASPPSGGSLMDAARLADERMQADRHARPRPRSSGARSNPATPAAV